MPAKTSAKGLWWRKQGSSPKVKVLLFSIYKKMAIYFPILEKKADHKRGHGGVLLF
jgi:hypothetical protein